MSRHIIKLKDENTNKEYYLMWSTIVNSPIKRGMPKNEFIQWLKAEYGEQYVQEWLNSENNFADIENFLKYNSAGENDEELTKEEIFELYCVKYRNK